MSFANTWLRRLQKKRGLNKMSNFCPCCDDFSIDASRARRKPKIKLNEKPKIKINVDNSDNNADWIKRVRKGN